ncbi:MULTISPECIES: L-serine ammonia-lyase [unclassified Gilliamella]|uniref:L-serine ammonia-lyase n=1 Tax=unclassified Gilliamella TaxID=2685620 RepID=UPI0022699103|nr:MULTISPECIES: L-serine ammonia-lyase [unclassified Gilliamella]MCX8575320.1 L-serine ammonia-lyase [Gilliamella sp. B3831]MCX8577640.1 L-serine ammonia-lyase [Gilliamella sp. B3815]MCX8589735.1 L-serine ammonia-lyase [Gilliamella sp. B3812]MCX8604683.1 L-serine ammonia-lyase [Gilliamella sp. B3823]MCX8606430.1 L-serine ammonia-lyase [Gilliamella sp. B3825]
MASVFEIFKIGIGPSSSHTVGPMRAGKAFIDQLIDNGQMPVVTKIIADVYGSLSLTGKGHHTDIAIILGLAGEKPDTVNIDDIPIFIQNLNQNKRLSIYNGRYEIAFSSENILFHSTFLPKHENGMTLTAYQGEQILAQTTYYSVGGGKIVEDTQFGQQDQNTVDFPYPFSSAAQLLQHCDENSLSISSILLKNELQLHSQQEIINYFTLVGQTMLDCIKRGIHTEGLLPGALKVPRRANALYRQLSTSKNDNDPMIIIDWINMFALAVSEENAAGGRVVTAPTNGACGIIPAVLAYYDKFIDPVTPDTYVRYFLTCGAIGLLYQNNASISGAEVGCQGEVGVACSMAAAGLAELLGGSPEQVCMAAEIGMEHNLGLTCDPVDGQVQVPCIERNAIAAVKAINATRMALRRTTAAIVSLDKVIETMYETGKDMNAKYRETSRGGLAITVHCS